MGGHREPKPGEIRYPFAPLAAALGLTEAAAARYLGLSGSTEVHYRQWGMSERVADRMAVRAGLHPYLVWPIMSDRDKAEVEHLDYKAASEARKRRADYRRAKYQNDPVERERRKAAAARYRAACASYVAEQNRRYREANRERRAAAERERYRRKRDEILAAQRAKRRNPQSSERKVA